jgi:hypothetical protein
MSLITSLDASADWTAATLLRAADSWSLKIDAGLFVSWFRCLIRQRVPLAGWERARNLIGDGVIYP